MNKKKKILIITSIIIILFGVIPIIFFFFNRTSGNAESYIQREAVVMSRDKDTGERIEYDKNRTAETDGNTPILVLGMEELIKKGVLALQVRVIREQLATFARERLKTKYESITLRPQDLKFQNGVVSSTIRLGESDFLLPITITAKNTGETQVIINDPNSIVGGTYTAQLVTLQAD